MHSQPRILVWLIRMLSGALLTAFASPAHAVVTISSTTHSSTAHTAQPLTISAADCAAKTTLAFSLTGLTANQNLQVWTSASSDCTQFTQREGITKTCNLVIDFGVQAPTSGTYNITSDQIANATSGITSCVDSSTTDAPRKITLYFLANVVAGTNTTDFAKQEQTIDLVAPSPPTQLAPSIYDDTTLLVKYCVPSSTGDIAGFYIYCDTAASGSVSSSASPSCSGSTSSTTTTSATTSTTTSTTTTTTTTTSTSASTTSASSSAATTTTTTTSTGGGTSSCSSTKLVKDAPGSSLASCGSVTGTAAEIQARGFTVNVLGAVAIAAYDAVGNVGKLSAVACGKTEPVIDFFQNYRAAGGEGGGGCSCRVGSGDEPLLAWVAFALCAASLMRRRACKR